MGYASILGANATMAMRPYYERYWVVLGAACAAATCYGSMYVYEYSIFNIQRFKCLMCTHTRAATALCNKIIQC